ncbi:MAG: DUF1993 domain-containing protein [Nostoc sp.]|uniref:DUF1993 domain-containing protein n=1 Tax=Nostoc sp. TaxID=1180 RepID=UPI002FF63454
MNNVHCTFLINSQQVNLGENWIAFSTIDSQTDNSSELQTLFPLSKQVQIASDTVNRGAARLAGIEPPKFEDNETTFGQLIDRIQKTISHLNTFKPEQIDGSEEREITLQMRDNTLSFQGMPFLLYFVLPNLYFHVTTAYDILRHCDVELGKGDFLGQP